MRMRRLLPIPDDLEVLVEVEKRDRSMRELRE